MMMNVSAKIVSLWKYFPVMIVVILLPITVSSSGDENQNEVNGNEGYSYSFSGNFDNPSDIPFAFPNFPSFNFNPIFSDYFDSIKRFNDDLASKAISSKGAFSYSNSISDGVGGKAYSSASINPTKSKSKDNDGIGSHIQAASSYANPANGVNIASRFADAAGGRGGGASASGYIGNGQVQQSASLYPQNPNNPNINTRSRANTGNGGSYGVFTSSFSETLPDRNGKPVTRQKASTTVNDNGKVTSYSVHNP